MKQLSKAMTLITILIFMSMSNPINAKTTMSIDSLWEQVKKHYKSSPDLALGYAKQLQDEAQKQGNQEQEANALWTIGYVNKNLNNYNESIEAYFQVATLYDGLDNRKYLADTYKNIGEIFADVKNDRAAIEFYNKALELYTLLSKETQMAKTHFEIGMASVNIEDFGKARTHLEVAQKLSKNKNLTQKTYNWLGILAYRKEDVQQAIKHYNKSLALAKSDNNQIEVTMLLYNIGEAYYKVGDIVQAKEYTNQSLELSRSIENLDKQIKPQILLAEIAMKERGENKEEVLALLSTIALFDAGVLNNYLFEALDYVSMSGYRKLLSLENTNLIIGQYAPQTKIANELYENTKTQLLQHSIQISIDNVQHKQKMMVLEENDGLKNWMILIIAIVFVAALGMLVYYFRRRGLKFEKQHVAKLGTIEAEMFKSREIHASELEAYITKLKETKENLIKANMRLKKARDEVKKKEDESLEKSLMIDLKDSEFKEVDDENTDLIKQKMHTNETMRAMEDKLLEGHDLMHQMNKYIWDVIIELQHKGHDVPPPLWNLRGDRDN